MARIEYPDGVVVGRPAPRLPELRRLREQRALSQAELAEQCGLSRATIVSLESGRAGAQYATIRALAEALGVSPAELIGGATHAGASRARRSKGE